MRHSLPRQVFVTVLSLQTALSPIIVSAQTVPVGVAPADQQTTLANAANGTPVVNIAAPNAAGVSHNRYTSYDVDARGLILNNSATNAVSQLGGGAAANPNFSANQAASLILNEVISANAGSMLRGYQEILGPQAELVIANPWGVTCDGCGFINTPRVTLTTGAPTLSASGALAGFTINGGQIAITGAGLDATRQSILDLLARSVVVDGDVVVGSSAQQGELQVVGGAHRFDYADRAASAIDASGAGPQFGVDSSALGGMYADRITLVVNEQGAGVRAAGQLAALGSDLIIRADGRIELRGEASAERDVSIRGGEIQMALANADAYVFGGGDLTLEARDDLELGVGSIGADGDVTMSAASLRDNGGANAQRFAGDAGALRVDVSGALDLAGGVWSAPQISMTGGAITVGDEATLYGYGATGSTLTLTTLGLLAINGGQVYSESDAAVTAQRVVLDADGVLAASGDLAATIGADGLDNAGVIDARSLSIAADASAVIRNRDGGVLLASDRLTAAGAVLVNDGDLAGASVSIATAATTNRGSIQAENALEITSASLTNDGADALILASSAAATARITSSVVSNSGVIWSEGDLTLSPTTLLQQRIAGATSNPLIGAGRDLTINYANAAALGTGDLQAGRDLTITGSSIVDRGALSGANADVRIAGRHLTATAATGGDVEIAGGQWYSGGDLRLTGDDIYVGSYFDQATSTRIDVAGVELIGAGDSGTLALTARTGGVRLDSDAAIFSGDALTLDQQTALIVEADDVLQADGRLAITANGAIDNYGTIFGGEAALASNGAALQFVNRSTGQLIGENAVQIGAAAQRAESITVEDSAAGADAGVYGGVLSFDALNVFNFGDIQAAGAGSRIVADGLVNYGTGRIMGFTDAGGQGGLTLLARVINNQGFLYDSSSLTVDANFISNNASGVIGGAGDVQIATLGVGGVAGSFDNLGEVWARTLGLTLYGGMTNGRDPGVIANRGYAASLYAEDNLSITAVGAPALLNYGSIESAGDMQITNVAGGGAGLFNEMSMVDASEQRWTRGNAMDPPGYGGDGYHGFRSGSDRREEFIDGESVYYFGITTGTAYQDWMTQYLWFGSLAIDPASVPQPTIRAGGDLLIDGFTMIRNVGGLLGADQDVTISSAAPGSSILNESLYTTNYDETVRGYRTYQCQIDVAGPAGPGNSTCLTANSLRMDDATLLPSIYSPPRNAGVAFAGRIFAGGNLDIQIAGSVTNSGLPNAFAGQTNTGPSQIGVVGVLPPGAPGSRAGATTLVLGGAQVSLPTSPNGRFVIGQGPGTGPLIETNPFFGIDSPALGSDYLADLLGLTPEHQTRRLGDDQYESWLIQQQVKAQTGRGLLEQYFNVDHMTQTLFDNAAEEAQALNLGYGKALTPEQIASLKSDIIWMVEQEVQGQKVLVPVVYLSDATRASITNNSTIAGFNTNIDAATVRNVGGEITAANTLAIRTSGDIGNLSGRMAGWNVKLDAGGDIVNSTLVRRYGDAQNGNDAAERTATIEAGNVAVLKAANDIRVTGAWVTAGKDAALIAGRNVNIEALTLTSNTHYQDGEDYYTAQRQFAQGAGVAAGGNLAIRAQNDVNIKGADVSAGGVAAIRAEEGSVNIGVVELNNTTESRTTTSGRYDLLDRNRDAGTIATGFGHEKKTTTERTSETIGVGSRVAGGQVVVTTGKGDVNVIGSALEGGEDGVVIDSARDVNVLAYNDRRESTTTTEATRGGLQIDISMDGVFAGTAQSGEKETTTTTQTTARTSSITSGGNVVIRGQGDVTNEGTRLEAAGDIALIGENVVNKAAQDTYSSTTTRTDRETKQQSGFTLNGTGQSAYDISQGKSQQLAINTPEAQVRLTGKGSTSTQSVSETRAIGTDIKAGGSVVVIAKNNASDTGTQYTAGKDIIISAENYENKAAADTRISSSERTYGSGQLTGGVNAAAEATFTASAEGGHEKSSESQSTAVVGGMKAGGAVVIQARSGDVVLEGTQIDGVQGVGITAARDLDIRQANDVTTKSSSSDTGSARASGSVSLVGAGGSVGGGASARTATSSESTSTARVANINSGGGSVQLEAGRDLKSQGTGIDAAGNVALTAGRDIDLAAATDTVTKDGRVQGGGADVNVGFGTGAAKGNGSLGVAVDFEDSNTDFESRTETGSTIKSGGQFSINAGGNARLEGTKVDADSAALRTGGDLTIESAQSTVRDNSYSVSGRVEATASKGGGTSGANNVGDNSGNATRGGNAGGGNAQVNVSRSVQDIETSSNATINTRGATSVSVGGDMKLAGANINAAGGVSGEVKGDLTIESRVDRIKVDQTDAKVYAGVAPVGGSGGGGKMERAEEGVQSGANHLGQTGAMIDVKSTQKDNLVIGTASGISGGAGGIDLKVGGDTTLTGAANQGGDFQTRGKTTVSNVETRVKESSTDFRFAGTTSSAAGSDQGKGGEYNLNVNLPGGASKPADGETNLPRRPLPPQDDAASTGAARPKPIEPAVGTSEPAVKAKPRVNNDDAPPTASKARVYNDDVQLAASKPRAEYGVETRVAAVRPTDVSRGGDAPDTGVDGPRNRAGAAPAIDANLPIPQDIRRTVETAAASDPRVAKLVEIDSSRPSVDRLQSQENLAAIVKFTASPEQQPMREKLLSQMDRSLQGPKVRDDGLTEFPVNPKYVGEDVPGLDNWFRRVDDSEKGQVRYFSEAEREQHRLYVDEGTLTFGNGAMKDGVYIFVVDRDGHLIAAKAETYVTHHSSLSGGEPVLMAGEMRITGGQISDISNQSGHFRPSEQAYKNFLASLRDSGVNLVQARAPALEFIQDRDGGFIPREVDHNLLERPNELRSPAAPLLKDLAKPADAIGPLDPNLSEGAPLERKGYITTDEPTARVMEADSPSLLLAA